MSLCHVDDFAYLCSAIMITDFEEYIRQGEPSRAERAQAWRTAIGLQDVDGLKPSAYLIDTAREHIEGDISLREVRQRIESYYENRTAREDTGSDERTKEADTVSYRITELLAEQAFSMTPAELIRIHRYLFTGIYKFAGRIRDYNITKKEWVLDGGTVIYAGAGLITETLEYDISTERDFSYEGLTADEAVRHIARFISNLWQVHPFGEGNTRTTAVFLIKYLRSFGFNVGNDTFDRHSWFFRNALVRANYNDLKNGITATTEPLERFLRHLLLNEEADLRNRTLHIKADGLKVRNGPLKSNLKVQNEPLNNLTGKASLTEIAVLQLIAENPSVKIEEMAANTKKSRSTIKRAIDRLREKGIIERTGAKKNGSWKILNGNEH